jgi:hypothetical protein
MCQEEMNFDLEWGLRERNMQLQRVFDPEKVYEQECNG